LFKTAIRTTLQLIFRMLLLPLKIKPIKVLVKSSLRLISRLLVQLPPEEIAKAASLVLPPPIMRNSRFFHLWENQGYHVTPVHFYQPIPDTRLLKKSLWSGESGLIGINMNVEKQLSLVQHFSEHFKDELLALSKNKPTTPYEYRWKNKFIPAVDAIALYCMVRHFKPRQVFEIGSGNSTYLTAHAVLANQKEGCETRLIAIEPYPGEVLKAGFPGLSELRVQKVEDIPLDMFGQLEAGDILFIDSSHVLTIGSDVYYEILEIIPRLKQGVIIHLHDIFWPKEYPYEWIVERRNFWNEQYILQAFLAFNHSFEILWASTYLSMKQHEPLKAAFGSLIANDLSGSLWMRRTNQ
jgi:hypothetical protein